MRDVTKLMVKDFKIMSLGYDFMGYNARNKEMLSFHHLIVPRTDCRIIGLDEGYYYWNGVILVKNTSHDYLHLIESKDLDMFFAITSEMIDMKASGRLETHNLRKINDVLCQFEKEYDTKTDKKGRVLIKERYYKRRKF